MKLRNMKTILIASLIVFASACSKEEGDVIATIGDTQISAQQFQAYLDFKRIKVDDEVHRERLLDEYLQRQGLSLLIQQKQDDEAKRLAAAELEDFTRQMTTSRYFERYLKTAVTDEKIRNYYLANPEKYQEEKVEVAHILTRLKRDMSETERKAKLTVINEAWSKLKAGSDFGEIASEYSEDKVSVKRGGNLGWMKKGAVNPRFSERIFNTPEGEISEPFETPFGYHIVKVIKAPKTITRPLQSVTGDIRYLLRQEAKKAQQEALSAELKISRTGH